MNDKNFPIIELINVSKRLNGKAILSKINLTIYRGEIVGITGPIGAGKTTLIQVALGLITPDAGVVQVFNRDLEAHRQYILQRLNFASSSLRLNGYSSVMESLLTFARLYSLASPLHKIYELSRALHITHLLGAGSKIYKLSAGESATVNLCKALLNDPELLFFDEITAHMDPSGIENFYTLLARRSNRGGAILISQNMLELQRVCNRIVFMKAGKILQIFSKNQFTKLAQLYD